MNIFKKIRASLRLQEAVRLADNAHSETGTCYYVMPTIGDKKLLIVMNRKDLRALRRKRYVPSYACVRDLEKECFYRTVRKNGGSPLTNDEIKRKRKEYFAWCESPME